MDTTSLKVTIDSINKKLVDLQKENNILKKKVKYLEEEKRRNNLIFFGIEEQVKEQSMDTYEVIVNVCWEWLGIDIGNSQVKEVYRMGHGENRPILVRLANRMIKEKIMDCKKALKDSNISIDEDFEYEVRCRRKVLVPFMKAARKNGHYAKLIKDKLKINGELFDVEFCLENLKTSENGDNIDKSKRLEIKERVRKIVNNSGRNRKGKVAEDMRAVTQEIAREECRKNPLSANSTQVVNSKAAAAPSSRRPVMTSPQGQASGTSIVSDGNRIGERQKGRERNAEPTKEETGEQGNEISAGNRSGSIECVKCARSVKRGGNNGEKPVYNLRKWCISGLK
ncbi:uncharacterized protein [Periplaneta americana]|uniref:uncharacterized protein isoform X1 n=1 Tax=Periplaneta americana TaxID=6978 RepID=UPI0037E9B6D1